MRRQNTLVSYDIVSGSSQVLAESRTRLSGTPRWTADDACVFLSGSERFEIFCPGQKTVPDENLVLMLDGKLAIRNPARNTTTVLPQTSDRISSYAVAPDQSRIVFSTMGQQLWIINTDGSNKRSLGAGLAPSWAPQGPWVVVMLTEDDGHAMLGSELYIINVDTGVRRNISHTPEILEMNPQWSPDGAWILYDTEGRGQLFVQQIVWR
jgi:tricorn protease-like protein